MIKMSNGLKINYFTKLEGGSARMVDIDTINYKVADTEALAKNKAVFTSSCSVVSRISVSDI